MPLLKKMSNLLTFTKSKPVVDAAADAEFVIFPKGDILKKDAEGNLVLKGDSNVAIIRKEDLDASGYGADATDDLAPDSTVNPEEAKIHAQNLDKCKGFVMKGAGLTDADLYGDPNAPGAEPMDGAEEAVKALRAAGLVKQADDMERRFVKRASAGAVNVDALVAAVIKGVTPQLTAIAADVDALKKGGGTGTGAILPRKGEGEGVVQKRETTTATELLGGGTGEGDNTPLGRLRKEMTELTEEGKSLLRKGNLSKDEQARAREISDRKILVGAHIQEAESAAARAARSTAATAA